MGKFCPRCGGPTKETDTFCGKCGMNLAGQPVVAAAPAPIRRRASKNPPLRKAANQVMQYVHFLLIGLLIFTLVLGILNLSAGYNVQVTAVAKYGGETQREKLTMALSEVYEVEEYVGFTIASLAYGVFNCVMTGFGGYAVYLRFRGNRRMKKLVKNYSLTGLSGNLIYLFLVLVLGVQREEYAGITMKAVIAPHFTVWLCILLFGVLLAAAMLSRNRRRRR